ncbi:hypothetical protein [Methanohalobium evestigatum]|nr:hypothetical protein [Methanohalobium evestigatum]
MESCGSDTSTPESTASAGKLVQMKNIDIERVIIKSFRLSNFIS